jgi:transposase
MVELHLKQGIKVAAIAEAYDVSDSTVYYAIKHHKTALKAKEEPFESITKPSKSDTPLKDNLIEVTKSEYTKILEMRKANMNITKISYAMHMTYLLVNEVLYEHTKGFLPHHKPDAASGGKTVKDGGGSISQGQKRSTNTSWAKCSKYRKAK